MKNKQIKALLLSIILIISTVLAEVSPIGAPLKASASDEEVERLYSDFITNRITGPEKKLCEEVKKQIDDVANGRRTSTEFHVPMALIFEKLSYTREELGVSKIVENSMITAEASAAFNAKFKVDIRTILLTLLYDCSFEAYWSCKKISYSYGSGYNATYNAKIGDFDRLYYPEDSELIISMRVDPSYQAGSKAYEVDPVKMANGVKAIANAKAIVKANESYSDRKKVENYVKAICDLVSYNEDARAGLVVNNINPWMAVYVFDNDKTTNVVCEGYAKAFQFLCDLTTWDGDVSCYTVNGNMRGGTGAGGHMWNILHFSDGMNYIVDVTNTDAGTIGSDDKFLLMGSAKSGNVKDGYTYVNKRGNTISYYYDADMSKIYSESELTLAPNSLNVVTPTVTPTSEPTVTPTVEPTETPTGGPVVTPTEAPTKEPTEVPTSTSTPSVTASPSPTQGSGEIETPEIPINPAGKLSINCDSITLPTKETFNLDVTLDGVNVDEKVEWASEDENIATVDEKGVITAVKYGKTYIKATYTNGKTFRCEVNAKFNDVAGSPEKGSAVYQYYYNPVYWAAERGITEGYDKVYFGVGESCTRASVMIFLWRINGSPTPKKDAKSYFNDVTSGRTTATNKAIAWAYEQGISKGYSDGRFGVKDDISRKDVLIMLYRIAGKPATSGTLKFSDCTSYKVGSDTYNAILWGSKVGITNGYSDGTFGPVKSCKREEIITFIYRYAK